MTWVKNSRRSASGRWQRVRALLAGGLVLGIGATVTLASWTDTEWVFGGTGSSGDDPPVGTSQFNVVQNTHDGSGFTDRESPNGGALAFSAAAADMSPGVTVHAPLQLAADIGSVGGSLVLMGAAAGSGTSQALFDALTYEVRTGVAQADCNPTGITSGNALVPAGTSLATGSGATAFAVPPGTPAAVGAPVDLCFALTLPPGADDSLQGLAAVPVWQFVATSD